MVAGSISFPEGSRSRDDGKTIGSSKRGVGRLVLVADHMPIVVPVCSYWDARNYANRSQLSQNWQDCYSCRSSLKNGDRLHELKVQVENLAIEQERHLRNRSTQSTESAYGILHQVDWELFGPDVCGKRFQRETRSTNCL
ncbi:hypothetical protein L6164_035009 [Bauhinia variegata]|uniref:Uncharacterized protein n=1 Tax=Bauhinia variegata TaxID=167791 RepID=A0ACB9KX93_BAUVA|nr:hypothetical protein L6164_035009 [Bauhinia variegata]